MIQKVLAQPHWQGKMTPRDYGPDAADLGTRQSVRQVRSRHERPIGVDLIQMAAGDTTACSTPTNRELEQLIAINQAHFSPVAQANQKI